MLNFYKKYKLLFNNMILSGVLSFSSDKIVQIYFDGKSWWDTDHKRSLKISGLVCLYGSPLQYLWFGRALPFVSSKILPSISNIFKDMSTLRLTLTAIFLDQTIYSIPASTVFFFLLDLLEDYTFKEALVDSYNKIWPTAVMRTKIWPLAHIITYSIIPTHFKAAWTNLIGFFWGIYISYIQHKNQPLHVQQNLK